MTKEEIMRKAFALMCVEPGKGYLQTLVLCPYCQCFHLHGTVGQADEHKKHGGTGSHCQSGGGAYYFELVGSISHEAAVAIRDAVYQLRDKHTA
jgi:hypothetical protein